MKSAAALIFAASLPTLLAAQNQKAAPFSTPTTAYITTSNGTTSQTSVATIQVPSCPIAMHAMQGSGSGLVIVRRQNPNGTEPSTDARPGQNIHLILGKIDGSQFADPQKIASGTVLVKGLSARDRLDLALSPSGERTSDLRRTVTATFSTTTDGTVSADLSLPGFTSVNSVKLESVSLTDGSNWSLADLKTCIVTPDRIMLIANQ